MVQQTASAAVAIPCLAAAALAALDERCQAPAIRCDRLEALASALGLTDQQKEELHHLNATLHEKMVRITVFRRAT
jgi:hypothetical protein